MKIDKSKKNKLNINNEINKKKINENPKKDFWDKLNIIFPKIGITIITTIATILITYFGNKYNSLQKEQQTQEMNIRLYSELMNNRETTDSNRRTKMLKYIMEMFSIYKNKKNNSKKEILILLKEKILNLELLVANFHDSLQLEPLFKHIKQEIKNSNYINNQEKKYFIYRLENAALKIIDKQMAILEGVGVKFDRDIETKNCQKQKLEDTTNINQIKYHFILECLEIEKENKSIEMRLTISDNTKKNNKIDTTFWLNYFNFPMINNIYLSKNQRCAVTLTYFDKNIAEITILFFPASYSSLKEKPYYEDIIENLIHSKIDY